MRKCLRRIVTAAAVLIALSVTAPLIYIEGSCGPSASTPASSGPAEALPAIDEPGYRRKQDNTFFTFPEWYIVYSFEDFGRFLDRSSESQFGYLSHILGFWRSFCTINRAVPASSESRFDVKSMIYVIGVSYSAEYAIKGILRKQHRPRHRMDQGCRPHAAGRLRARGAAGLRRVSLRHPLVQIPVPGEARWPDGDLGADAEPHPLRGARLRARRRIFRQDRLRLADPESARRLRRRRAARRHVRGVDAAAGNADERAAHQTGPRAERRSGSWCRRRVTRS